MVLYIGYFLILSLVLALALVYVIGLTMINTNSNKDSILNLEYLLLICFVFLVLAFIGYSIHYTLLNYDLDYFLSYGYKSDDPIHQKCMDRFINEKERYSWMTFEIFDFKECTVSASENIKLEEIKLK